jgi:class 3 adenylate cyclase/tetratricopeptide (TPR) repeat protein
MKCLRCLHESPSDADFCPECGAKLDVVCAACGTTNAPTHKFCKKCGRALGAGAGHGQVGVSSTAPSSYTPKHLAEKILTSKSALEGERKQVTVLFADLKGSMELLADRDPEEARKLLDPVLERMIEAVHRYEGTVNQVMGDGIMALFGAPLAHEDHAVRACYAALRMQESVRQYAAGIRRDEGVSIQIRVGLNSGDVVVRSIGSDLRMDYTAVGQTTHLAARMEQLAAPGSIRLTAETLQLAEGFVQVTPRGPVPIKGLGEPIEVFELVGAGAARTRLEAAARRGLTRFVGRSAELEQLRGALDRASEGHGQVVAVVGEPGVGKSRLFWELTHSHGVHGWLIVQSASVSYGKATAYLPVVELLRSYFEIESRVDSRKIREKVTGKVLTLAPALGPVVPALLALLDMPVDEPSWQALDPPQRRQQTLDAVKRLLLRESEAQPLVVIFEDLHWIDGETQTLLDSLVESLPAARLVLLVNYRREYQHAWGGKTYYRQLRIDPLPPESADELLDALIGTDSALGPLKQLLIERTEANPLFLEESVQALVETGALAGDRGAYRLTRPVEQLTIPATVQAILAARIDRLHPDVKQLLQTASVVGEDVPFPLLQSIVDSPDEELRHALSQLQHGEFLYEASLFPDLEYTFKHALTHEVAYGSMLGDRRRALHARIVDAMEHLHANRLAEQVERLARHALRGERWPQAVAYLPQAAAKAVGRGANREAVSYFEEALSALRHLPESAATVAQTIDLRIELRNTLLALVELPRALDCLREAETSARALGDGQRLARVVTHKTHTLWLLGHIQQALTAGQEAVARASALRDFSLGVAAPSTWARYIGRLAIIGWPSCSSGATSPSWTGRGPGNAWACTPCRTCLPAASSLSASPWSASSPKEKTRGGKRGTQPRRSVTHSASCRRTRPRDLRTSARGISTRPSRSSSEASTCVACGTSGSGCPPWPARSAWPTRSRVAMRMV